jgi:hypothetical protein
LTVTVEPASAVPVITMPTRGLSRVDRVVATLDAGDRNRGAAVTVRVWVAVAVLPRRIRGRDVDRERAIRPAAAPDGRGVGAVRATSRPRH